MKKFFLTSLVAVATVASFEAQAQTSKGDIWLGGASNLAVNITPEFGLNASVTGDYYLQDRLSLGAALDLGIGSATTIGLSPRVQYFFTESLYAHVNANVVDVAAETTVGLNSLNAGVGYWYSLGDNVVASPMLMLNNLTGDEMAIGLMMSLQVKL